MMIKKRFKYHQSESRRNKTNFVLHKAMRKYGNENFIIEEICECNNQDELNNMEEHYIVEYDTIIDHQKGYNMTYGGEGGGRRSETTRKNMSIAQMKEKNPMYGKNRPDVALRNKLNPICGEKHPMYGKRGKDNPNFGRKHKLEELQKMRDYIRTDDEKFEIKNKLSKSLSYKWEITTPNKHILIVDNLKKFCMENNLNYTCMSMVNIGIRPHHRGYICKKLYR